ncbi:hypothetical protein ACFYZ5_46880 [Streptomyces chartreusis]|uniref:MmyB family transcriptional regulator n=1 Tax=Streptomyces chartreusis TaxID=1969 RepID=UPI0036AAC31E
MSASIRSRSRIIAVNVSSATPRSPGTSTHGSTVAITLPGRDRRSVNIVWRAFYDDTGRVRHPNPEEHRASLVADLRDTAARYPADRELADMIGALRTSSADFARLWAGSTVAHHKGEKKTVDHPHVGEVELDCDVLSAHGSDLRIVVYAAEPGSEAAGKLRLLTVLGLQNMPSARELPW